VMPEDWAAGVVRVRGAVEQESIAPARMGARMVGRSRIFLGRNCTGFILDCGLRL